MTLKIQKTLITDAGVEIFVANAATPEQATEWFHFYMRVSLPSDEPLEEHRLKALQKLRDALSEQIQAITHRTNRNS